MVAKNEMDKTNSPSDKRPKEDVMKKVLITIYVGVIIVIGLVTYIFFGSRNNSWMPSEYGIALTSSNNGYGYDPAAQKAESHPMAIALISSAESNRFIHTYNKVALKNAIQNADWLVENKDINGNNIIGWGHPDAWDAFGDGSVNPANTEYTITTALAVQGLLDVVDAIDKSDFITKFLYRNKKAAYFNVAQEAVDSFIENKFYTNDSDGTIFFWYSSQISDSKFVTNCHAMLIGNLQRISTYLKDKDRKRVYLELADKGMRYLLKTKREKNGGWYWLYYPQAKIPVEDYGVHVVYTADGILKYKKYGGSFSEQIDEQKILDGLKLYITDGKVLEMFSKPERVRSWDLGYFLYAISYYFPQEREFKETIYQNILSRQEKDGFRFLEDKNSPTNFVRHNAHILLGLSKYFWN